ncbi:MAG: tetratricopeptide repeat protein [Planctomycetaceae bacterium]|nr:tetratricopeptide repeat protein [Planctomycetaceae bacterium]
MTVIGPRSTSPGWRRRNVAAPAALPRIGMVPTGPSWYPATVRYPQSWITIALVLALSSAGCRLPGQQGPVPQSVAECRRLSREGAAALERGQQQTAENLLAQAVTASATDAEARRRYAESLWLRGAQQEAIKQIEEAGRLTPDDASLWARLAEMYLAAGQSQSAWQSAHRAIELDPKLPAAWAIRGGILRAAGQPRDALSDYLRALNYAPKDRALLGEVAQLYRQLDRPTAALQTLQTLAETYSPGEEPALVLDQLGTAYVAASRYDDAVQTLSAAVARGEPTADMYCHLGDAELLAGHAVEATAAARRALALQPQHQPTRQLLDRITVAQQPHGTVTR